MKVTLSDGRVVQIGVRFGDEQPKLDRPLKIPGKFRSVRINLTVSENGKEIGSMTGVSYCNPADAFSRFEGRKRAMKRLFLYDGIKTLLLSKQDRRQLVPILLARQVQVIRGEFNKKRSKSRLKAALAKSVANKQIRYSNQ
jgi:hypothetical protein